MAPWLGGYRVTHVYDPAGNRLVKNESGALTTYSYDPAAQLQTAVDAAGVTTYSYDGAGNQLLEVAPAGRTTYSWTAENLLAGIATPDGTLVENLYNADFRRVSRNTSGPQGAETTKFVWDLPEDNVMLELDGGGEISAHYATEPALYGSILAQTRLGSSPATAFLHHDAIGSTLAATDLAQAIAASYAYTAFGVRTQSSGNLMLPFQYVGQAGYYTDGVLSAAGIQLPYIRRRWYRPSTIRWLSVDPLVFKGGKFAAPFDTYIYVRNLPLTLLDPIGLSSVDFAAIFLPRFVPLPRLGPIGSPPIGPTPSLPAPPLLPRQDIPAPARCPIPRPKPPGPGSPKGPDEDRWFDCPSELYQLLRRAVLAKCGRLPSRELGVCTGITIGILCKELRARAQRWTACADARKELDDQCFGGGNQIHKHEQQMARWHARTCWYKFDWWGCGGGPPWNDESGLA